MKTTGVGLRFYLLVAIAGPLAAEVRPNALFSDGAVFQQVAEIPVWGTAVPDEKITVEFAGETVSTIARNGFWEVRFKPRPAGGPFGMRMTGENKLEVENILIGEVWVCSGQSNMAAKFRKPGEANDPGLRMFLAEKRSAALPTRELAGKWLVCSPETAAQFSAVGYFFGRDLRQATNRPVGLILSSWGGTRAESWISLAALERNPDFSKETKAARSFAAADPQARAAFPAALAEFEARRKHWNETDGKAFAEAIEAWKPANRQAMAEGKPGIPKPVPASPEPKAPISPDQSPGNPTVLFNGMIHPLMPFAIRGVIWYQGESNNDRPQIYHKLFASLIADWRQQWGQGSFSFLFVQIAPHKSSRPELREAQLQTWQTTPNTAMAVITDAGDAEDIHPKNKEPVGARLALAARALAYGEKIEYSGPVFESLEIDQARAILHFTHQGGGLVAKDGPLKGFQIAGADRNFVEATAEISDDTVVVSNGKVNAPVAVRYGWSNVPDGNLYNQAGLPASPFRTDGPPPQSNENQ